MRFFGGTGNEGHASPELFPHQDGVVKVETEPSRERGFYDTLIKRV